MATIRAALDRRVCIRENASAHKRKYRQNGAAQKGKFSAVSMTLEHGGAAVWIMQV
jgi:hypothetical protein